MSSKGTPDTPAKRRRMVAYDPKQQPQQQQQQKYKKKIQLKQPVWVNQSSSACHLAATFENRREGGCSMRMSFIIRGEFHCLPSSGHFWKHAKRANFNEIGVRLPSSGRGGQQTLCKWVESGANFLQFCVIMQMRPRGRTSRKMKMEGGDPPPSLSVGNVGNEGKRLFVIWWSNS